MLDHTETVMNIQERFDSRVIIILTLSIHNIIQKISSDVYLSDQNNCIVVSSLICDWSESRTSRVDLIG